MSARCLTLAAALLLAACSEPERPLSLPEEIPGGWRRTGVETVAKAEAPGRLAMAGFKAGLRGRYEGPATVEVEVFELANGTEAFAIQQGWRPDGKRMIARKNQYFITAQSPHPDRTMLGDFLTALEKLL